MITKKQFKVFLKEPIVALYFIQGHINWFLFGKFIKRYWKKKEECPDCFEANQCKQCGCEFGPIALSSKCKRK